MIKNYNWILILTTILISCTPTPEVRFLEPQPINKRNLKTIPKNYHGQYLSKSDSSILTIDSNIIFQEWIDLAKVSDIEMQEELDTVYKNDVVIHESNWTMTVDVDNDSTTIKVYGIDTLFVLSDNTILKRYKGYLFLNYKRADSTWRVKTLKLESGQLDFDKLIDHSQIDSLREVTNIVTEFDTVSNRVEYYDLNPKRKELKEILKRKRSDSGFIKLD